MRQVLFLCLPVPTWTFFSNCAIVHHIPSRNSLGIDERLTCIVFVGATSAARTPVPNRASPDNLIEARLHGRVIHVYLRIF